MNKITWILLIAGLMLASCAQQSKQATSDTPPPPTEENGSEWTVLFDGTSLDAWRNYQSETLSDKWQIEDGTMTLSEKGAGDIITKNQYESFILELEWKISKNGNSGIFFHVAEADSLKRVYHSGPEIQILDNDGHKDGKIKTHRAGDNYDLESVSKETVKPVGEWNQVKVVVDNGRVEQWLNGHKGVEYQLGSPKWEEQYQKSKFTKWPMYGRAGKGHIALQDHGDKVWFRNIRIKEL